MTTTTAKNAPNTTPCDPNASGTASAATNIAAEATRIDPHTSASSGSTEFVSHANDAHGHQSAPRISSPWPSPLQVGSSESTVVTCVNAKTNTRSKKSSSGVTRCSRSARSSLTPGRVPYGSPERRKSGAVQANRGGARALERPEAPVLHAVGEGRAHARGVAGVRGPVPVRGQGGRDRGAHRG